MPRCVVPDAAVCKAAIQLYGVYTRDAKNVFDVILLKQLYKYYTNSKHSGSHNNRGWQQIISTGYCYQVPGKLIVASVSGTKKAASVGRFVFSVDDDTWHTVDARVACQVH